MFKLFEGHCLKEHFEKNKCIVTLVVVVPVINELSGKQTGHLPQE